MSKTLKIHVRSRPFLLFFFKNPFSTLSCLKWNCTESEHWFTSGLEGGETGLFFCQGVYRFRLCHPVCRQTQATASDPHLLCLSVCLLHLEKFGVRAV